MPTHVYILLLLTIDLYSHVTIIKTMQCIAMKHFITNVHMTHTFANVVQKLITSRSRLSIDVFLINVKKWPPKKGLPKIY